MGTPTRHPAGWPVPVQPTATAQLVYTCGWDGEPVRLLFAVRQGANGPYAVTPAVWRLGEALQRSGSRYL